MNALKPYDIWDSLWKVSKTDVIKLNPNSDMEDIVKTLISEEFFKIVKYDDAILCEIDALLGHLGYEWDTLSEEGHMRFRPYAVSMNEAMKNLAWDNIESFSEFIEIPIQRISGGDLYTENNVDIARHINLATKSGMYGTSMYTVAAQQRQVLRFSACCNKLGMAQSLNITKQQLPFGIFEISKSYRCEEAQQLRLAERVRCFHLPELHILNSNISEAMEIVERAHQFIDSNISDLGYDYIILCSVTENFFQKNQDFIKRISERTANPILVNVTSAEDEMCENGVQFDIEYKALTSYGGFIEIATLQVDDGSTDFSYNIKCEDRPVSTIHAVLFASIERAVFSFAERAVHNKSVTDHYCLPFWLSPIQCRIIANKKNDFYEVESMLKQKQIRYDVDDRDITLEQKMQDWDMRFTPFCIIIDNEPKFFDCRKNKFTSKETFCSMIDQLVPSGKRSVPLYSSKFLSHRMF